MGCFTSPAAQLVPYCEMVGAGQGDVHPTPAYLTLPLRDAGRYNISNNDTHNMLIDLVVAGTAWMFRRLVIYW